MCPPNLVLGVAVDVCRARRAMRWVIGLQAALLVVVLSLTVWLLPLYGLAGVGLPGTPRPERRCPGRRPPGRRREGEDDDRPTRPGPRGDR
ncbi:hypothetical protein [Kitasatospora sp. Root187]|uniref:hypothetical protein n=2 Tax=unclassified Kitasatospora TaxID=2633591 RepID=UPI00070A75E3|nr:hypothetical protein [Kitasatospora sp. Root187]KQV04737.1 hypothetical protein ASC99_15295 [Kitasatospora sp. Root107]